jgi:hypothetical protein
MVKRSGESTLNLALFYRYAWGFGNMRVPGGLSRAVQGQCLLFKPTFLVISAISPIELSVSSYLKYSKYAIQTFAAALVLQAVAV